METISKLLVTQRKKKLEAEERAKKEREERQQKKLDILNKYDYKGKFQVFRQ